MKKILALILLFSSFVAPMMVSNPGYAEGACFIVDSDLELERVDCVLLPEIEEGIAENKCYILQFVEGGDISNLAESIEFTETECPSGTVSSTQENLGECDKGGFFGLPVWYKYLDSFKVRDPLTGGTTCNIEITSLGSVLLILAAIVEILLRVAALIAVGFIVYGGVLYVISQSQPDKTSQALKTVLNAIIGLTIAIAATGLVSFIAGRF